MKRYGQRYEDRKFYEPEEITGLISRASGSRLRRQKIVVLGGCLVVFAVYIYLAKRWTDSVGLVPAIKPLQDNNIIAADASRLNNDVLLRPPPTTAKGAINPHDYEYLINEGHLCANRRVRLLVFVSSAVEHMERRQAIRDTWGAPRATTHGAGRDVVIVFLLGKPSKQELQHRVALESSRYHDIIQEDFVDSYLNLTLKSVMGLKWAMTHCAHADYVMKTDDDIYVNVPRLVTFLHAEGRPRWIVGCIKQRKSPTPISLHGLPAPPGHPPFVAGAGYVISGDLVTPLYEASLLRPILPVEDVYITAHCGRAIGVHPDHREGFSCGEPVGHECYMALQYTGHHVSPDKQRHLWKVLNDPSGPCS